MGPKLGHWQKFSVTLIGVALLGGAGCCWAPKNPCPTEPHGPIGSVVHSFGAEAGPVAPDVPRELQKVTLPEYTIAAPDVLLVDLVKAVPLPPYRVESLDTLYVEDAFPPPPPAPPGPEAPPPVDPYAALRFTGEYTVELGGVLDLGPMYGQLRIGGMTLDEVEQVIRERLQQQGLKPNLFGRVALVRSTAALQQVAGEHLVGPDGTISLGVYGSVYVTGLTRHQARFAIEMHLRRYLEDPEVSVDVAGYNSMVYYIITQGHAVGDGVFRLPVTGNETVLDAIAQIQGLQPYSSRHHIWVARPAPDGMPCDQILPVDWHGITKRGSTATNYQLMPGDRVYIAEDKFHALDAVVAKVVSPFERMFGFTALGTGVVSQLRFFKAQGTRGGFGGGF